MFKKQEIKFKTFTWINIVDADKAALEVLAKQYGFHHLAIEDCVLHIEQPKIDDYDDYLFMVFHLPRYIKASSRTTALELDVFLNNNLVITIHDGGLKPLNLLFDNLQNNKEKLTNERAAYLLYEILNRSFNYCLPMLDKIGAKLDKAEDDLYEDQSRKTLEQISLIAQDIINFRRVIGPQRFFIKDLEVVKSKFITENLEIYFEDIGDKIDRIWESLNNYKEVCEVLQRTSESMLTQRLNEIMKILTIFSAIMLPLTVITGFYGMNVLGLPFASHRYASEIILGMLIILIMGMLFYFVKKKWL